MGTELGRVTENSAPQRIDVQVEDIDIPDLSYVATWTGATGSFPALTN
jgi:hypothetical protein